MVNGMRPLPTPLDGTLDEHSLRSLRDTLGSDESFQDILRDFLTSSGQLSRHLEAGLAGGAAKEVGLAAHTLKSMALLVGANGLRETCRQVESLSHAAPPVPAPLLRATLEQLALARRAVGSLVA